jgi:hypothetical protein
VEAIVYVNVTGDLETPSSKAEAIVYVNVTVYNQKCKCLCKCYMRCWKQNNFNHKWKQMFM